MMFSIVANMLLLCTVLTISFYFVNYFKKILDTAFDRLPTRLLVFKHFITASLYFFAFLVAISTVPFLQQMTQTLLLSSGIFAIVAGFAAQEVLSNIMSGIYVALTQPFSINDHIKVGEAEGVVQDITLRYTVIYHQQSGNKFLVPNKMIVSQIIKL